MILLGLAGCAAEAGSDQAVGGAGSVTSAPSTSFMPVTAPPPTFGPLDPASAPAAASTTAVASGGDRGDGRDVLSGLMIAPEAAATAYDRDLFTYWIDADGDGCDTRCEVLDTERRFDLPGLATGWLSIYDGYTTADPDELEVDHLVALAEAWRSGTDSWDAERRAAFANDLDDPDALIAVSAATNRSKSDSDPASWQPPARGSWCQWADAWVRVKVKWQLTADEAEVAALRNILAGCGS